MKDLAYQALETYMYPFSTIYGHKVKIWELLRNLIEFHFPDAKVIWDPTCGKDNYQFKEYLKRTEDGWIYAGRYKYYASDLLKTPWNCDKESCLRVDVLNPPWDLPFEPDLVVYDPPYIPFKVSSKRNNAYGMDINRGLEGIRDYYAPRVFEAFAETVRKGLIVKGADFYLPKFSENLRLFLVDVLDLAAIRRWFKPVALYVYRYFTADAFIHRAMTSKASQIRGIRRNIINHSYYLILKKK